MIGHGRLARLLSFNPLIRLLNLVRQPVEQARVPDAETFGVALGITVVAVAAASLVLARLQRKLIFHL